jgi:hypothetical protein
VAGWCWQCGCGGVQVRDDTPEECCRRVNSTRRSPPAVSRMSRWLVTLSISPHSTRAMELIKRRRACDAPDPQHHTPARAQRPASLSFGSCGVGASEMPGTARRRSAPHAVTTRVPVSRVRGPGAHRCAGLRAGVRSILGRSGFRQSCVCPQIVSAERTMGDGTDVLTDRLS